MSDTFTARTGSSNPVALKGQLLRFAAVGVVGTCVHYAVLISVVELGHQSPVVGTSAGFMVAALVSYVLNRRYTFSATPNFGAGLLRNYLALAVGLGINVGAVALLTHWRMIYIAAQAVATILAFIWNFLASRFIVFRDPPAGQVATSPPPAG